MTRFFSLLPVLGLLAACATTDINTAPLADLGAYRLGHNVVVASKAQQGPISRDATPEEWVSVMKSAVANRFGQYEGNQLYHFGISVEGYMLAPPGVPLVYKPKSVLILNVTVWDDAANKKLNEKVHQITVFEDTTGESFLVGSGHQRTKEQQMAGLAANAVREIEKWMVEQKKENGWFLPRPGAATTAIVERTEGTAVQE
ncbi:hypothetical protein ACXYMO_08330 [Arenibacterium sp. CAU 1754]